MTAIHRCGKKILNPGWNFIDYKYRIKPESKLRPYKDAKEFLEAQQKHGLYLKRFGNFYLPSVVTESSIVISENCICSWGAILQYYKWKDGAPCGILEE